MCCDMPTEVLGIIYEKMFSGFTYIPGGVYKIGSPGTEATHRNDEDLHKLP